MTTAELIRRAFDLARVSRRDALYYQATDYPTLARRSWRCAHQFIAECRRLKAQGAPQFLGKDEDGLATYQLPFEL